MKDKLTITIGREDLKKMELDREKYKNLFEKQVSKLNSNYIKTTITREKLYERNYTRDYIEIVNTTNRAVSKEERYKSLIDILVNEYLDSKKSI